MILNDPKCLSQSLVHHDMKLIWATLPTPSLRNIPTVYFPSLVESPAVSLSASLSFASPALEKHGKTRIKNAMGWLLLLLLLVLVSLSVAVAVVVAVVLVLLLVVVAVVPMMEA